MRGSFRNDLYLFSLTPAIAVIIGNLSGGIFTLSNITYSVIFWGLLEWALPASSSNDHSPRQDTLPKFILILHIPFQIAAVTSLFYGIHIGKIEAWWIIPAALSTGLNSGTSALIVAHEFIHRKALWEQSFGKFLLFTAGNVYFFIEHLKVHHKWVGTEKDPATAKFGENLYHFFVRSAREQLVGSVTLEAERLRKENRRPFSLRNYVIRQLALQVAFMILIVLLNPLLVFAWLIQCTLANFLLEYVNYIQHYGLTRDEKQRPNEEHSWESDQFASRFILVDVSRHADHHYYAGKPYHTLINYERAPKLPSGYSGLFIFALVPVFWRRLIHPRLTEFAHSHEKVHNKR